MKAMATRRKHIGLKNLILTAIAASFISGNTVTTEQITQPKPVIPQVRLETVAYRPNNSYKFTEYEPPQKEVQEESKETKIELSSEDPFFTELYLDRAAKILDNNWERKEFQRRIDRIAKQGDLNRTAQDTLTLVAQRAIESGGNPRAVSYKGAAGDGQFTDSAGEQYGLYQSRYFDFRFAPEKSIPAMAEYMKDSIERFGNDLEKVLLAYHDGPNASTTNSNLSGEELYRRAGPNARFYLREVGAVRELIKCGELVYEPTSEYTDQLNDSIVHKIRAGETIYSLARKYRVGTDAIRKTNYSLKNLNNVPIGAEIRIPRQ